MGSHETTKKRILPDWMMKRVAEPVQCAERKQKRKKKTFTRIKTVYCMNEAELVDTALCILAENCKVEETEVTSSEEEAHDCLNVSACSSCSSANGSNAATMTTVGAKSPKRLEDLGCSEKVKSGDDEDDALKYVREIFFT